MSDLFRKEVVEKRGQKLFGDVILAAPLSHIAVAGLIVLIVVGLVSFAIIGEYARKERVFGYLTPDTGLVRILPQQVGVIEKIYKDAGDDISKGEPLYKIQLDTASEIGLNTAEELLSQLSDEYNDLEDRVNLIPKEYRLTRNRLIQQAEAAEREVERSRNQISLQAKTVENQKTILERFQNLLAEEAISQLEVSSQENSFYQSSLTLENLRNAQKNLEASAQDIRAQLTLMPVNQQKAESELKSRMSAVAQRMVTAKGQGANLIMSPVDGRIASQTGRLGQMATGEKALATILPQGGRMQAELLVPTRAAGFMKEGQGVRLLYDAFPYQKFGFNSGQIIYVSRTIVGPQDLPVNVDVQEPVFLVRVSLDAQDVDAFGEKYPLQAGMTLSADIILEDRKIWEWVFEPLLGAMK